MTITQVSAFRARFYSNLKRKSNRKRLLFCFANAFRSVI